MGDSDDDMPPFEDRSTFGDVIGLAGPFDVPVYSSLYRKMPAGVAYEGGDSYNSYIDDPTISYRKLQCGYKYQCVEFARRYLIHTYNVTFPSIPMAYQIFDLDHFLRVPFTEEEEDKKVDIIKCLNGSTVCPKPYEVLIWSNAKLRPGHVGIIIEVAENYVGVAEQNWFDHIWPEEHKHFSRKLPLRREIDEATGELRYYVGDPEEVHVRGWIQVVSDMVSKK